MKRRYKTKHHKQLLDFFMARKGEHFNAEEVYQHFSNTPSPMGKATVYRGLDRLVQEGELVQYYIDPASSSRYSYHQDAGDDQPHYHALCTDCEELYHISCGELDDLVAHMAKDHQFQLDPLRLVLYGHCGRCTNQGGEKR